MPRSLLPTFLSLLCLAPMPARSAELRILPAEVTLTGPQATQRPLVVAEASGKVIGERTGQAQFVSSQPSVAAVDSAGMLQAVGDGEATITATADGKPATARVKVRKFKEPFTWSFRNHVIP